MLVSQNVLSVNVGFDLVLINAIVLGGGIDLVVILEGAVAVT